VLPCFVEWRYYPNWNYDRSKLKQIDSAHFKKQTKNDSTWGHIPSLESFYCTKINNELFYFIRQYVPDARETIIQKNDSLRLTSFLSRELKRIEAYLDENKVSSYTITDSLYTFLCNFPAQHHVILDVVANHGEIREAKVPDLYWFSRIFVIDMRSKQLVFYSFKEISSGGGDFLCKNGKYRKMYYMPHLRNDFPRLEKTTKGYKKYLKKNKEYLGKQK
jgi:hypothetical protein